MVHVDAGTPYALVASSDGMELVGGPAPADPASTRTCADVAVRVFHCDEPGALLPMIASDARLMVWPGTGSQTPT